MGCTQCAGEAPSGKQLQLQSGSYEPVKMNQRVFQLMNAGQQMQIMESNFWNHALITWVVVPVFVVLQVYVPYLEPSCSEGFRDCTIFVVLAIEAHHIFAEQKCWTAAKALVTPPELSVLRHLGVLRHRSRFALLGILECLDLYTDLTFPFIARVCDENITEKWRHAWQQVPYLGKQLDAFVSVSRFWGLALMCVSLNVLITGLLGLWRMRQQVLLRKHLLHIDDTTDDFTRISGEVFFGWARSAETAMMPSVAMLCEEMASQKRWKFDPSKDASAATKGRERYTLGKMDLKELEMSEVQDLEEKERVDAAGKFHFTLLLFIKVFIGNVLSLWLQGSFLALTFDVTENEAKVKIIASMVISAVQATVRCIHASDQLGLFGCLSSGFIMFFVGWSFTKVYFAYSCKDHLWNLTSGCVKLDAPDTSTLYIR